MSTEPTIDLRWLLSKKVAPAHPEQPYGNLTSLNTSRTILDAIGETALRDIVDDYLDLLGTSAAVYERNGDYAHGIFASGWCRLLDARSRELAATESNAEALAGGAWHCHESCWRTSRTSIEQRAETDLECLGGIRIVAVPIIAGDEVVGSINFGYGSPPRDQATLEEIGTRYELDPRELESEAAAYQPPPDFVVELARKRLRAAARLIGEIVQRRRAELAVRELNDRLESLVKERTAALEQTVRDLRVTNEELETFAYSFAHDVRAPLRTIAGFARVLTDRFTTRLDEKGRHYVDRMRANAEDVAQLVDDLLNLSRVARSEMRRGPVDLAALARAVVDELRHADPERDVEVALTEPLTAFGDRRLLSIVLDNLIRNAWKFTSRQVQPRIAIGASGRGAYFVRDNGVGFDMAYAGKLFRPFERLHDGSDYQGSGIGLATVQRIVRRHGGEAWAESIPQQGTTIYFTLGENDGRDGNEVATRG